MTHKQQKKGKDVTLKRLQAQLRRLPEPQVPENLKATLFAAIPNTHAKAAPDRHLRYYKVRDLGMTAVAAVLIVALMSLVNYSLSVPSETPYTEFDTALWDTRWDQNNLLYDQNNTYIEKSLPHDPRSPIIKRNQGVH